MNFLTPEIVKGTDWSALERAVARLMSHCGWRDVRVIGGRGDQGGDVIGIRDEDGAQSRVFVVQVKAISGDNYVGPAAIREAMTALSMYEGDVAVVATNGDFTRSAVKRQEKLLNDGFDVRIWNGTFLQELLEGWSDAPTARRELRNYQQDIVELCLTKYDAGAARAQFVVATGLGKTVIAAEILSRLRARGLSRALVLCHAQSLALQLQQAFWSQLGKTVPTRLFFDGALSKPYDGVNFGLYQTLANNLTGIEPSDYDLVIVDEAHHAMSHGFRACLQYLRPKFLIGMTATPWRADGISIDGLFGEPVAQVSLVDGMKMGFLAQVDYRIYCDTIDWKEVSEQTRGQATIRNLNRRLFIPQRDEVIIREIVQAAKTTPNPRIAIFCASIEHCKRFADLLSRSSSLVCRQLSGVDRVERNRTLMEFATGRIQAVTAVDVLNEGIDVPDVNLLVFLRSTHSRRVFIQQLGRGLRLSPGKEKLVVLDFVSDVRRLANILAMDTEARQPPRGDFQVLHFANGIVTFMNEETQPFVERWLHDVVSLEDADESRLLKFPFET